MLFSTIAQPQMFLWMMLSGMAAAVWFEIVDGFRRLMQAGRILSFFTDVIFAAGLSAILILFFLLGNYGQFRLYGLAGAACGYALLRFALLRPAKALIQRAAKRFSAFWARISQKRLFNIIFK